MGSLAVSRLAIEETLPSASIADQVAAIARKELAPQALAIDEGTLYPDAVLRRLGQSTILGFLLTGLAIGPGALRLIPEEEIDMAVGKLRRNMRGSASLLSGAGTISR